jgi:hypothetical protein
VSAHRKHLDQQALQDLEEAERCFPAYLEYVRLELFLDREPLAYGPWLVQQQEGGDPAKLEVDTV